MNLEATKNRILEQSQKAILEDYQWIRDKAEELIAYVLECIEKNRFREGMSSSFIVPIPDIDKSFLSAFNKSDAIRLIVLIAQNGLCKHFYVNAYDEPSGRSFYIDVSDSGRFDRTIYNNIHGYSVVYDFSLYNSIYNGLFPLHMHQLSNKNKEILLSEALSSISDKDYFLENIAIYIGKDEEKELQRKEKQKESEELCESKDHNREKEPRDEKQQNEQQTEQKEIEQSTLNNEQYGSLGSILFLSTIITIIAFIIGAKFV